MIHKILISSFDKNIFDVNVTSGVTDKKLKLINYLDLYIFLKLEKDKILNKLRSYYSAGIIGSIFYPSNKHIQPELDILVKNKQIINKALKQIHDIYL